MKTKANDGIAENKKKQLEREYYNLKYIYSKLDYMFNLSDALNRLYCSCSTLSQDDRVYMKDSYLKRIKDIELLLTLSHT